MEEYDPATDTWRRRANMLIPREDLAAVAVGGLIYAFGGYNENLRSLSSMEVYNPLIDTLTTTILPETIIVTESITITQTERTTITITSKEATFIPGMTGIPLLVVLAVLGVWKKRR